MRKTDFKRSERVYFHDQGLSGVDDMLSGNGKMLTLGGAMKRLGHENVSLCNSRDDSRFAPSQWETALLSNDVFHWLGASLESALK